MAFLTTSPDEIGYVLEISGEELDTITRALQKALERAVTVDAGADIHELTELMNDIDNYRGDD